MRKEGSVEMLNEPVISLTAEETGDEPCFDVSINELIEILETGV